MCMRECPHGCNMMYNVYHIQDVWGIVHVQYMYVGAGSCHVVRSKWWVDIIYFIVSLFVMSFARPVKTDHNYLFSCPVLPTWYVYVFTSPVLAVVFKNCLDILKAGWKPFLTIHVIKLILILNSFVWIFSGDRLLCDLLCDLLLI